ncbi:uncharacterized protein A4U43_C03F16980 [Asparagus officinalis]|uniref:Uncharacterized protein n=1 Tax=Asparagus officinalis TaxID=4686 RepID=A0A5P1FFP2_ASPOF|nr:uncharacterized protein A4U43_C03F16980 [Asparagus officinalis]
MKRFVEVNPEGCFRFDWWDWVNLMLKGRDKYNGLFFATIPFLENLEAGHELISMLENIKDSTPLVRRAISSLYEGDIYSKREWESVNPSARTMQQLNQLAE